MSVLSFLKSTAWCIPIAMAVSDAIVSVVKVQGLSMQPSLNSDPARCDWVLVEKVSCKWLRHVDRGAVMVLWAPDDPHQQLVKRVIALPGDFLRDPEGGTVPIKVPQGRCWVEGDNPEHSADSRNLYGPVHLGLLEGRVTHVVWPPSHVGRVLEHVPPGRLLEEEGSSVSWL